MSFPRPPRPRKSLLLPLPGPAPEGQKWVRDSQGIPHLKFKTLREMLPRTKKPPG